MTDDRGRADASLERIQHRLRELGERLNQLADEVAHLRYDYGQRLDRLEGPQEATRP